MTGSPPPGPDTSDPATTAPEPPETGDDTVDDALRELARVPADDLDNQLETGERLQQTLRARLGDLGG
ncbi:hypothetical protein [Phycicoccus flavus]|uniref:Uncharacterized protein n=1 Tax=Phycicoccus flavus TaxID=2502783 RepID=A0A8T6R4R4_9MICO|nr:hypothetical protein [Phycicoccus flavus]NHA67785.1 hypothetical protein [Phycicoccus flavus]